MVSQAPQEVRQKLKDWVKPKENALSVEDALGFGSVLKKLLEEKGIPMDRGCRIQQITSTTDDESGPMEEKSGESEGGEREARGIKVVSNNKYRTTIGDRLPNVTHAVQLIISCGNVQIDIAQGVVKPAITLRTVANGQEVGQDSSPVHRGKTFIKYPTKRRLSH